MNKSHPNQVINLKGPKFDPKRHTIAGSATCSACRQTFASFFYLRKHVEASTCPRVELLHRQQEELPTEIQDQQNQAQQLQEAATRDPEAAARNPAFHSLFMESSTICRQLLSGQKGAKQHLNKQHPNIMSKLDKLLQPRLQHFKVVLHKGDTCRYCRLKVDAPGRYAQQCVPLLQAHVLQEVTRQKLDTEYDPKTKAQSSSTQGSTATSLPGLTSSIFVLEGFLLLANTRNHCYANASLQRLHWSTQALRSGPLQPTDRLSKLVRITPERSTFNTITAGWVFDGRQHDASEFLLQVFQNLQPPLVAGKHDPPFQRG